MASKNDGNEQKFIRLSRRRPHSASMDNGQLAEVGRFRLPTLLDSFLRG